MEVMSLDKVLEWTFSVGTFSENQIKFLTSKDPAIVENYLYCMQVQTKLAFYRAYISNPDLVFRLYNDKWLPILREFSKGWDIGKFSPYDGSQLSDLHKILSQVDAQTPTIREMFDRYYKSSSYYLSTERSSFYYFATRLFKEDPEYCLDKIRDPEFKSQGMMIRQELYMAAIETKNLDVKMARKIRSESSEGVCNQSVKFLISRSGNYTPAEFKELMMQLVDVKHHMAQYTIAKEVGHHLLPYFLGFDYEQARKEIARRLAATVEK